MSHEIRNLGEENEFSIKTVDDSLNKLTAVLKGPEDTPYEGGEFRISIQIPSQYPFSPPKLKFITPIYHPNIDTQGNICLDVLKSEWSPSLTLEKVLYSLSSLLNDPNPDDPLRSDVARVYNNDREKYNEEARKQTLERASSSLIE